MFPSTVRRNGTPVIRKLLITQDCCMKRRQDQDMLGREGSGKGQDGTKIEKQESVQRTLIAGRVSETTHDGLSTSYPRKPSKKGS